MNEMNIVPGEIAALTHEVFDDPVEGAAFVVQRLTRLCNSFVAGAESAEVFGSSVTKKRIAER